MFRLIRLVILIGVAFVGGVLYERDRMQTLCAERAGDWRGGLCLGSEIPDE